MTLLSLSEHIERCLAERADEVRKQTSNTQVTYSAIVGKQSFVVTVEELAKDSDEPAIT